MAGSAASSHRPSRQALRTPLGYGIADAGAEPSPLPHWFVAATVTAYMTPSTRPLRVQPVPGTAGGVAVVEHPAPGTPLPAAGVAVTVYPVSGLPPSEAGGDQLTEIAAWLGESDAGSGVLGTPPHGVAAAVEAADVQPPIRARTVGVRSAPMATSAVDPVTPWASTVLPSSTSYRSPRGAPRAPAAGESVQLTRQVDPSTRVAATDAGAYGSRSRLLTLVAAEVVAVNAAKATPSRHTPAAPTPLPAARTRNRRNRPTEPGSAFALIDWGAPARVHPLGVSPPWPRGGCARAPRAARRAGR